MLVSLMAMCSHYMRQLYLVKIISQNSYTQILGLSNAVEIESVIVNWIVGEGSI